MIVACDLWQHYISPSGANFLEIISISAVNSTQNYHRVIVGTFTFGQWRFCMGSQCELLKILVVVVVVLLFYVHGK